MTNKPSFVLGIAPTRRDSMSFDPRFARENRERIMRRLREILSRILQVEVVDIDWLNPEGLLIYPQEAPKVAEYFAAHKVDAVFVPHCNFGSEEAVAKLGGLLKKPLLLWGPRDPVPPAQGMRETDTQCGLFATGMILSRYNVPFTYLPNCWLDDPRLETGLENFIRTANVVKAFRNLRIGQVSLRPRTFSTVKVNENDLLERFGIEVVSIDTLEITSEIKRALEENPDRVEREVSLLRQRFDTGVMGEEELRAVAAIQQAFLELAGKYGCSAMVSECWKTYSMQFGVQPCAAFGRLIEQGLPVACEADIHGVISSVLLSAAYLGNEPHFLADLTIRHPENDNAELLWHCGPFPVSLAHQDARPWLEDGKGQFELKEGEVTVARFGESHGEYRLFIGEGRSCSGPPTNGTYLWMEVDDWEAWEQRLVQGPYVHHISGIYGRCAHILREACRYIGVIPEQMGNVRPLYK